MRSGNIYKTAGGSVIIITKVSDDYVHWISASCANSSGGTNKITTEDLVDCDCVENFGEPDTADLDCPVCHGNGKVKNMVYGMDKATYLADNMFDYIKSRLLKNFDF